MKLTKGQKSALARIDPFVGGMVVCAIAQRWKLKGRMVDSEKSKDEFALEVFEVLGIR